MLRHDGPADADTTRPGRSRRTVRRPAVRKALGVAGLALLLTACSGDQSALDPQGIWAQKPHDLIKPIFAIAAVVFVLVQGLIVYAVFKYREKPDDDGTLPVQVHGNTKLELTWTIIPALILAVIAVPTVQLIFELEEEDPAAMEIEVVGHRWWWEYRYDAPDGEIIRTANELVIPQGQEVRLMMTAEEAGGPENAVLHSYWVPKLAGKKDVVPGRVNTLRMKAPETGTADTYLGQCAEYCGLSHANMRHRVIALPQAEYDAWFANQQQPGVTPEPGTAEARGYDLVMSNSCIGCHAIEGTPAVGAVGPNLTHFATRDTFAGSIYDVADRDDLEEWVYDAPSKKAMHPTQRPAIGMPSFKDSLTPEQVSDIVDYLYSLD